MTNPLPDGRAQEDVEAAISRDVPAELLHLPITISLDPPDCAWAQEVCLRLAGHPHPSVRGNAVLALGHLARTCGALDEARVRPVLVGALDDAEAYVRGQAHAAAGDVARFLGWDLSLPNPERDWFAGRRVPGVRFALNDAVTIASGEHVGEGGAVVWWTGSEGEPRYVVELGSGTGDVDVPESALRPAEGDGASARPDGGA